MRESLRLFLVLLTVVVILIAWISRQMGNPRMQLLIIALIASSVLLFVVLNLTDAAAARKNRKRREARSPDKGAGQPDSGEHGTPDANRSGTPFRLKDRKQGLTWGGGNITASEAKRGTRRKFLGK